MRAEVGSTGGGADWIRPVIQKKNVKTNSERPMKVACTSKQPSSTGTGDVGKEALELGLA